MQTTFSIRDCNRFVQIFSQVMVCLSALSVCLSVSIMTVSLAVVMYSNDTSPVAPQR